MKICHIIIENFRSIDYFDEEVGKHNIIVGKNNTGKSNLLWAIYSFYYPKNLSVEDFIIRQNDEEESEKKLQITLTFDSLTDIEQNNNKMYFFDGKIKIRLKAWIDDDRKLKYEHNGYEQRSIRKYPEDFDISFKTLLENDKPKRSDFNEYDEIKEIMEDIVPEGRITADDKQKINEVYLSSHPEIEKEIIVLLSDTQYHGFIKTNNPKAIGECYFIPAIKDPKEELQTTKTTSPVYQMIRSILSDIKAEDIKEDFREIQKQVKNERQTNLEMLRKSFNDELELFNTSVDINLQDVEISEAFPLHIDILFNDGVPTPLNNKGTGLQRYALFKFLKIKNELNLGQDISYILLFEEPEAHLHPQFQREIAKILKDLSENTNYQTFITSHSPQFIDLLNLDYVFIFNKEKECTKPNKCELHLTDIKEEIKTLLLFDPNVKEIFFSEKIVLIEGPSEEIISNILIQKGNLDVSNVSIIKAESKYNIPRFIKVFNSLKIPYTILIDEDPYFLPDYTKTNPSRIKQKRRAYKMTLKIAKIIDESLGKIIVISPDFDDFIGVSRNQSKNLGKPTAVYNKYKELEGKNDEIIKDVEELFDLLINPQNLNHMISNPDGSEWKYQDNASVEVSEASFNDFKEAIKQKIKLYKRVCEKLSSNEVEELKNMFELKKKSAEKSITKSTGPLNNWIKSKNLSDEKIKSKK
jgi:predicted ATP-dependent endonuclease of OLD family